MEMTGSLPATKPVSFEARLIMKRLEMLGIPRNYIDQQQSGVIAYVKDKDVDPEQLIGAIFPIDAHIIRRCNIDMLFQESVHWLKWLIFRGDPVTLIENFSHESGPCVAVLTRMNIRYKCITCEIDDNCAICLDCFERGDHRKDGHDYRLRFAGGGFCDCGDILSMKRIGFCSNHKGNEQLQPLSSEFACSMRSILDYLFSFWRDWLVPSQQTPKDVQEKLSSAVVELLLELCGQSKSLGSLISERLFSSLDLMEILVRLEQVFTSPDAPTVSLIVKRLHELLSILLLLGELGYQHGFAKVFLRYYPTVFTSAFQSRYEYPLLSIFSLQIFTRPTLTLQLVKEDDLLSMLFSQCLKKIFIICAGDDDRLEVTEWNKLYKTTIGVLESVRYITSHYDVTIYVARERQDITRMWMHILSFVQGFNPQLRETEKLGKQPFELGNLLAINNTYLLGGAFSHEVEELEDPDSVRPAKIARISQESSISTLAGTSKVADTKHDYVSWLTFECLRTIDSWLVSLLGQEASGSGSEAKSLKLLCSSVWINPVILQDTSVHIPLHRLLSTILHRFLRKCYGESAILNSTSGGLPSTNSDFFSGILRGCHPCGFSAYIMEHPLRIRVLCTEARAGKWDKYPYGYAFGACRKLYLHSQSWYENGLELDLFLLQCCAAFAPESDLYVENILERYGLSEYLNLKYPEPAHEPEPEDPTKYEHILVQEMLTLIIQIVKERRFSGGLTTGQCIRRALLHKLYVRDAPRSTLVNSIGEDLLGSGDDLQQILGSIAEYSGPVGFKPGMFKLRSECWNELDLYHLRWEAKDLQLAEDRYNEACGVSAVTAQLPSWSQTYPPLSGIARIATCKKTLQIVRAVLFNAFFWDKSSFPTPDVVVWAALHLLSLALNICSQQRASGQSEVIPILEFACEEISASGDDKHHSLLSILVLLMRRPVVGGNDNLPSFCGNILNKLAELDLNCSGILQTIAPEVFGGLWDSSVLARESEKAKGRERQAALMRIFKAKQSEVLKIMEADVSISTDSGTEEREDQLDTDKKEEECHLCHSHSKSPMCIVVHLQKSRVQSILDRGAVVCKPDSVNNATNTPLPRNSSHTVQSAIDSFVLDLKSEDALAGVSSVEKLEEHMFTRCFAGETQKRGSHSLLLENYVASIEKDKRTYSSGHDEAESSSRTPEYTYGGFGPTDCDGIYLSSCGHAMHQSCLAHYISSLPEREQQSEDAQDVVEAAYKVEFNCPTCRSLANCVIPTSSEKVPVSSDAEISSASSSTGGNSLQTEEAVSLFQKAASFAGDEESIKLIQLHQFEWQSSCLDSLFRAINMMYFPSRENMFQSGRANNTLLLWDMLKYSIASTEIAARSEKLLPNEPKLSGGSILSLLLNIAQGSKTKSMPTAFLRYRGIQLFEQSLCLGSSSADDKLHLLDSEVKCSDVQFWKRASDPVLAHDTFSSLMWALFCLPTSFLSCKKSFLCLVHVFYLVAVTQAIATLFRKRPCSVTEWCTELGLEDCLVTDICKVIKDSEIPFQHLDSNYIDSSCNDDIKDAIHSLSSPFLRRCSLLWGLVNSSDTPQSNTVDIAEVERLQLMFNIPPIDAFMNDDMSRAMVTRWLNHFSTEFRFEGQNVLYCTPSVPFSLMILPKSYEQIMKWFNKIYCPHCTRYLESPALCLYCGQLCDSSSISCCSAVKAQNHAMSCGAGAAVFLLIQATSTLIQTAARAHNDDREDIWPSPYLNEYGEEDIEVLQGRPLELFQERCDILAQMVASHSLYHKGPHPGKVAEEEEDAELAAALEDGEDSSDE